MTRDHKDYASRQNVSKQQQNEGEIVKRVREELERVLTLHEDKPISTITTYMAAWMAQNGIVREDFETATKCRLQSFVQQTAAMMEF